MNIEENQITEISFDELMDMSGIEIDSESEVSFDEEPKVEPTTNEELELETEEKQETVSFEQPSIHLSLLQEKLKTGEWDDVVIVDGDKEIKLSEMDNVDEETYNLILSEQKVLRDEDIKNNYIKVDGLTDIQKSLINIVKEGDLDKARELFENPQTLVDPLVGYDSDNENHQQNLLAWYYSQNPMHSEEDIKDLVEKATKNLTLEDKAKKIEVWQREQYQNKIKEKEIAIREEKALEQENIKKFRKELITELKSTVEEGLAKRFADVATKYDNNGELEVDKTYDEWMKDPKKASELIHFMYDRESFIKKLTAETKRNVQLDVAKKVHIIRTSAKSETVKPKDEEFDNPFPGLEFK